MPRACFRLDKLQEGVRFLDPFFLWIHTVSKRPLFPGVAVAIDNLSYIYSSNSKLTWSFGFSWQKPVSLFLCMTDFFSSKRAGYPKNAEMTHLGQAYCSWQTNTPASLRQLVRAFLKTPKDSQRGLTANSQSITPSLAHISCLIFISPSFVLPGIVSQTNGTQVFVSRSAFVVHQDKKRSHFQFSVMMLNLLTTFHN